jgi:hypothetical protein
MKEVIAEDSEEFYCLTQQNMAIWLGYSEQEQFIPVYETDTFYITSGIWEGCKFISGDNT